MKERLNNLVLCVIEIVLGVLLLINPVGFTSGIIITAGIFLLLLGVRSVVKYFRADAAQAAEGQLFSKGLLLLLSGGFCVLYTEWFLVAFPLLTMLYGVLILLIGLSKLQQMVDCLRLKRQKWFLPAISAVVSILCAIVILSDPFSSTAALWIFTGVSLIAEAICDVITLVLTRPQDSGEPVV